MKDKKNAVCFPCPIVISDLPLGEKNNNTNSLQNTVQNIKAKLAEQGGLLLFCKYTAYQPQIPKEEAGTESAMPWARAQL